MPCRCLLMQQRTQPYLLVFQASVQPVGTASRGVTHAPMVLSHATLRVRAGVVVLCMRSSRKQAGQPCARY